MGKLDGGKAKLLCTAGRMGTVYDSTSADEDQWEKKSMETM